MQLSLIVLIFIEQCVWSDWSLTVNSVACNRIILAIFPWKSHFPFWRCLISLQIITVIAHWKCVYVQHCSLIRTPTASFKLICKYKFGDYWRLYNLSKHFVCSRVFTVFSRTKLQTLQQRHFGLDCFSSVLGHHSECVRRSSHRSSSNPGTLTLKLCRK